ncbi:MAG: hypothetical protein U1E86_06335 [Burkholderiaceae bacterium]
MNADDQSASVPHRENPAESYLRFFTPPKVEPREGGRGTPTFKIFSLQIDPPEIRQTNGTRSPFVGR